MLKKISYIILIIIIIIGGAFIGMKGFEKDVQYKENAAIYVQIGKSFENRDMRSIAKEVFGDQRIAIQKVELYEDMVSFTIAEMSDEDLKPKIEELNNKINEKYELENKVENISIIHNPKIRLLDIVRPYIIPVALCTVLILVYAMIRYSKLGVFKTLGKYLVGILGTEALYVSIIAITRFPINILVIPVGLFIYLLAILVVTVKREKRLAQKSEKVED